MNDLWAAIGLVLVLEGALYALFPHGMIEMVKKLPELPISSIRLMGITFVILGWLVVWWVRST
ncbi:MAG: hypothetical protein AUK35_00200 [Zetaproteobacteria bacterium CG2_30_46_52]|nr:MAG: hypothetical protein AUK35_00200 [Zetaproteobacteria bacterium CG2_30_46_52]